MLLKETSVGNFLVKCLYKVLDDSRVVAFPHRFIWNYCVPSKVGFLAWEATWGRILTLHMLKRCTRALANICFLCKEKEETIDHLLLHCSKSRLLWDLLLAIVGVNWVFPLIVREALLSWNGSFVGKKHKKAWMVAPLMIFWTIWRERNNIVFDNKVFSTQRMKSSFLYNLWIGLVL